MNTDEHILRIHDLGMRYGKTVALKALTLNVRQGDIYGLIGPNGAGKTTTFRIVATVMKQTSGLVMVDGINMADPKRIQDLRRRIGYMPDSFGVYDDMTVQEYLAFFAAAYGITNPKRQRLVNDVLELVDLGGKRDSLVEALE